MVQASRRRVSLTLPILTKEMRSQMRGARGPVTLLVASALTVVIAIFLIAQGWENLAGTSATVHREMTQLGRTLFMGLVITEGVICALIAPALTAGALTVERERQTLEMLFLTRLSNANLVLGKYASSLSFAVILLLCALPVAALSFVFGGVDPGKLGMAFLLILAVIMLFGAIGVYSSACSPKTGPAVARAYLLCLAWAAGIGGVLVLLTIMNSEFFNSGNRIPKIYPVMATLFAGAAAVYPGVLLCALITAIRRRLLPWFVTIGIWAALTAPAAYWLATHGKTVQGLFSGNAEPILLLFLGNPIFAMVFNLMSEEMLAGATVGGLAWMPNLFAPITAGIHLLFAAAFLALAIGHLRRQRELQAG